MSICCEGCYRLGIKHEKERMLKFINEMEEEFDKHSTSHEKDE